MVEDNEIHIRSVKKGMLNNSSKLNKQKSDLKSSEIQRFRLSSKNWASLTIITSTLYLAEDNQIVNN